MITGKKPSVSQEAFLFSRSLFPVFSELFESFKTL